MLTVDARRTASQSREINQEHALVQKAEDLLGDREARIFPPDHIVPEWQIFVRHSTATTDTHPTVADALRDLIAKLEAEK